MALFDLARMTVSSSGTGTITLNAAVSGFLTFDLAGCSTAAAGQAVTYAIADTAASEIGSGTYTSSSLSLTRGSVHSTNGNNAINMNASAIVLITPQAKGIIGKVNIQSFTANGTYTPTTGLISALIECLGSGGAGGGVVGSSIGLLGGGAGGAGGYSRSVKLSSQIGASQAVTVGAAGAGVSGATGGTGSATSVGALVSANGGSGADAYGGASLGVGGAGGAAGTGDIAAPGQRGMDGSGFATAAVLNSLARSPNGAGSVYGEGGMGSVVAAAGSANGGNASGYGAGGAGGAVSTSTASVAGGNGGSGIAIVTEYCSL